MDVCWVNCRKKSALKTEGGGFEEEDLNTELGDDESEDGGQATKSDKLTFCNISMMCVYNFSPCLNSVMVPSKWGLVMDRLMVLFRKFFDILTHVQAFLWRVLELHIFKIVALFVIWVSLGEVSE